MKPARLEITPQTSEITWQAFPLGDVFARLRAKKDGLSRAEAARRLEQFGPNALQYRRPYGSILKSILVQFIKPWSAVLALAGVLVAAAGSWTDAAAIFAAIIFYGLACFFKDYSAGKLLRGLSEVGSHVATVRREGAYLAVPATEVVPGDIMAVKAGDKIPADARLIQSFNLKTDESVLAGFSKDRTKQAGDLTLDVPWAERSNVIWAGSFVTAGGGEAVVFATGKSSEIFRERSGQKQTIPPYQELFEKRTKKLVRFVCAAAAALSGLAAAAGILLGHSISETLFKTAAFAVLAVPAGLPAALMLAVPRSLKQIFKAGGLARNLWTIENLGNAGVVLTDKTGILTRGEMRLAKILTPEKRNGVLEMSAAIGQVSNHLLVLSYGVMVSETIFRPNPVEKALLEAARAAGLDFKKINGKFKKLGRMPFDSARGWTASFREDEAGSAWAVLAGSTDALLNHVKKIQVWDRYENAIPFELSMVKEAAEALAKAGLTVMAVCSQPLKKMSPGACIDLAEGLTLVGLLGFKAEVGKEIKETLALARRAGLRTVLVTADGLLTARAAALEAGLVPKNRSRDLEAVEVRDVVSLSIKELSHRVRSIDVFSRVSPEQRLKIVEAWRAAGETVIAVGHEAEDSGALKAADLGVALESGSDRAKDSSGLVLLGGGFPALIKIVKASRILLLNVKKTVAYLLALAWGEIILLALSFILAWPLFFSLPQILWINLIHTVWGVLAFTVSNASARYIMEEPPPTALLDASARFLIIAGGILNSAVLSFLFLFFKSASEGLGETQSAMFAALGVWALLFSLAFFDLKRPWWGLPFFKDRRPFVFLGLGFLVLAAAIYLPPFSFLLRLRPIGFLEWVIVLGAGFINLVLAEAAKWFFLRRKQILSTK